MNGAIPSRDAGEFSRSGMTLIELVVVLALLAGLAAMTLTGVGDLGNRARYDETTQRMSLIRRAVVGDGVAAGRFVRDMGRLPLVHAGTDGVRLEELWRDAGGIGYRTATLDLDAGAAQWEGWSTFGAHLPASVELLCGWNGPYVMVDDPATAELYDGFGNPWQVEGNAINAVITNITSLGSDGAAGGTAWDEADRALNLSALLPETTLTVLVRARNSTNALDAAWRPVEAVGAAVVRTNTPPYKLHKLYVALFTPEVSASAAGIRRDIRPATATEVAGEATFQGLAPALMPTDCKVFAYGHLGDPPEAASLQVSGVEPEAVALQPGRNTITLYLREAQP